jgi:hypothetical protein
MPERPRSVLGASMTLASLLALHPHALRAQASVPPHDTAPTAARDPHAAQPERPTVATHAYTVAPGYVEIEAGVQDSRPASGSQFAAPFVAKIGLAQRTQLELQSGYARIRGSDAVSGPMDLGIAVKQRVLEAAPVVHDLSVQGTLKLATGARGVGTGTADLSALLISSRPLRDAELDLNAGYTHRSGDGQHVPTSATVLAASFGTPIRGPLGAVAELFDFPGTGGPAGQGPALGVTVGPTWQMRPWLVFDAGAVLDVRGLGANAVYAGVTYNVGRIPGWRSAMRAGMAR